MPALFRVSGRKGGGLATIQGPFLQKTRFANALNLIGSLSPVAGNLYAPALNE
jgi:hypothetical protein